MTFNVTGLVTTDFRAGTDEAHKLLVQTDGKLVAVGFASIGSEEGEEPPTTPGGGGQGGGHGSEETLLPDPLADFALARYNPDGSLDTTFGEGGQVITDVSLLANGVVEGEDKAFDAALQADGKIVVVGHATNATGGLDFAVARYNPDGSLDETFDGDGVLVTDFGQDDQAVGVVITATGAIVAAGSTGTGEGEEATSDFALARYDATGALDTTFGTDGKTVTDLGGKDIAKRMGQFSDGRIVVAGMTESEETAGGPDFAVALYTSEGILDPSFDGDGFTTTDFSASKDEAGGVVVQPDDRIVVVGTVGLDIGLARYNTDGSLDLDFGAGGKVTTDFAGGPDFAYAVTVQPDGKIVAAGRVSEVGPFRFGLARYNPDGSLDLTFDHDGKVITFFPGTHGPAMAYTVTLQGNKIVAAGVAGADFALARYIANEPPMASAGGPYALTEGEELTLDASASTDLDGDALAYTWDVNGDGVFGDAVGVNPTLYPVQLAALGIVNGPATFQVVVRVEDAFGNVTDSDPVDLTVANAPPTGLALNPSFVEENVPLGTTVGTFTATDPGGDPITFRLVAGPGADDNARFEIVGDELRTNAPINFEADPSFSIRVRASDPDGGSVERVFTIDVTDMSDVTTVGMFDPTTGTWYLRDSNSAGSVDEEPFPYGLPGWYPVVGDWDGDGRDTVGVVDPTGDSSPGDLVWYLRNGESHGAPDIDPFPYGFQTWTPVVGDWDGDGTDTVGVVDPSAMLDPLGRDARWLLRDSNTPGAPDIAPFFYGYRTWTPVVGDWDGDGIATIGMFDPSTATWYLRNSNSAGAADLTFSYGGAGWTPVVGDWDGDGITTVAVVDPAGVWYIRNSNTHGAPDIEPFPYGMGDWVPMAGDYNFPAAPLRTVPGDRAGQAPALSDGELQAAVAVALGQLEDAQVSPEVLDRLGSVQFEVGALPGGYLGMWYADQNQVVIDEDAAGNGWDRMDLTTAVLHELGHSAGLSDLSGPAAGENLMSSLLLPGQQHTDALDAAFQGL